MKLQVKLGNIQITQPKNCNLIGGGGGSTLFGARPACLNVIRPEKVSSTRNVFPTRWRP